MKKLPTISNSAIVRSNINLSKILTAAFFGIMLIFGFITNLQAAPGDLDTTFGAGKTFTSFSSSNDSITSSAVQADGKTVVVGAYYSGISFDVAAARYNTDGSLDTSFNGTGKFTYAVSGNNSDGASAVAIDANGKIVITGFYISGAGNHNTFVMRLNSNGTLDTTFGGTGLVQTDVSGGARNNRAFSIALQSDGKIVVAGYSNNASTGNNFSVVRYTSTGAVDFIRLFDVSLIAGVDEAYSVVVQTDGKIIAGGYAYTNSGGSGYDFALLRLNADGTVDNTYSGGVVHTNFNSQSDYIFSAALQSDGKLVVAGIGSDTVRGNFGLARYNTNGTLDTSFDADGKVTTNFNNNQSGINGVKIQSDGKIVAVGYNSNGTNNDFALARYNFDGSLDTSFDGDGKVVAALSSFNNLAYTVALQSDGKIIAAGNGNNNNNTQDDFAVARFNANGSLDTTFAPSGKVTTAFGDRNEDFADMAIQPDGKIVVVGSINTLADVSRNFVAARYNTDGTLDTTFSDDGKVITNVRGDDEAYAVAIQTDGRIVVAGFSSIGTGADFSIVRYNANGTLDTSFSGDGIDVRNISQTITGVADSNDVIKDVLIQPDGKIVVGGYADNGTTAGADFVIVRYNSDGNSLDNTFNGNGIFRSNITGASQSDSVNAIALQSDGKYVFAGQTLNGTNYSIAVGRVNTNGLWDNSFDGEGIAITSGNLVARDLVLQPDGKVIVAGNTNGSNEDLMLARYTTTGSLDSTFGSSGIVITPVGTSHEAITNVALQSDGKIIAAGHSINTSTGYDFSIERYNTNGSLDTTFGIGGIAKTIFGNGNDIGGGLALQSDGKIVVGGYTNNGTNNDFAMARYLPGANCTYSISPANANVSAAGSSGSIAVTANESYCGWTAISNAGWLSVTSGASGVGSGTAFYSVAANSGAARSGTITVAGQTFTVNQAAAVDVSMPTNLQSLKNNAVTVPLNVSDTTDKGIISFDFSVSYDAGVLTPQATVFDASGTLASGFNFNVNSGTAGVIHVSGYGTAPLSGAGVLLNLKFTAIGTAPACSALTFSAFQFNDGNPTAATANGQVCIVNGSVSGAVTNANTIGNLAVPNVNLTAVGATTFSASTATNGNYLLEGFGNGTYTVTPSKSGGFDANTITSFDASMISRYSVQLESLNANQLLAADVSGNGSVNSYDAALISQYLVSTANPGNSGTWKFVPASRQYTDLTANQPNQNYVAILMGDVSGNWTAPNPFAEFMQEKDELGANPISVNLPNSYAAEGQFVTVPVRVGDTAGRGVLSYDFELAFNPSVLQLDSITPVDKNGTVSSQLNFTSNGNISARLLVSAYGTQPLAGAGTLLNLRFRVVGAAGSVSPLTWQRFLFNETPQLSNAQNGQIQIVAPTAANSSVSGRVSSADGNGIRNVIVSLTDADGNTRTTRTSTFGYYRFDEVESGETYTLSVQSKRFSFNQPTRILTVQEDVQEVDFTANE